VAARLGASLLLEPRNERLDGEGLGEVTGARGSGVVVVGRGSGGRGGRGSRGGGRGGGRGGRGGLGGGLRAGAGGGAAEEGGTGDLVAAVVAVDADLDAGVVGRVELVCGGAGGGLGTGASDLDVDALRVVLGAVLLACRVQGNDLVAENVLAGGNRLGDLDGPSEVVGDELLGGPLATVETGLVDLEEAQVRGLGGGRVVDLGEVVDDGAVVGRGPGVPGHVDGSAGRNLCDFGTSGRILVTGDLGGIGVHAGLDEALVLALGARPLNNLRGRSLILEGRVVGLEVGAVDLDGGEDTVGLGGGSHGSEDSSDLNLGRHLGFGVGQMGCLGGKCWRLKVNFGINEGISECEPLQSMKGKRM
jgi:hypothetical protein